MATVKRHPLYFILFLLLCSCSSVETGRYLVARSQEQGTALPQDVWRTYGLASSGASRRMTVEPSYGRKRPMIYKRQFNADLTYILYPVIVRERVLFFGPALVTVLPVWFFETNDANDQTSPNSVSISWFGDVSKVDQIVVRCFVSGEWLGSSRRVFVKLDNHIECEYHFDKKLTDGCEIVMDYANGRQVVRSSLSYCQGLEWTPYVRMLNAPKYPETYPGLRSREKQK